MSQVEARGDRNTTFARQERFADPLANKNFRIGAKPIGPTPTSYHTFQGGFVHKKSFNLRFLQ